MTVRSQTGSSGRNPPNGGLQGQLQPRALRMAQRDAPIFRAVWPLELGPAGRTSPDRRLAGAPPRRLSAPQTAFLVSGGEQKKRARSPAQRELTRMCRGPVPGLPSLFALGVRFFRSLFTKW